MVGALLTFPVASYLAALDRLGELHYTTVATVLRVIVGQVLLEAPILAFRIAPTGPDRHPPGPLVQSPLAERRGSWTYL